MHWNYDSGLIRLANIDCMAATLPAEFKTQMFGYADYCFGLTAGTFGVTRESRWA